MSIHRKHPHDLDEVFSEVSFEPGVAFTERLRAQLEQKLGAEEVRVVWSNGRRPLPDSRKKHEAPPADEEDRPMKNSRLFAVFALGLTALVAVVLIGVFAVGNSGPWQPAAATEEAAEIEDEPTPQPMEEIRGPSEEEAEADIELPPLLPGERVVTNIADLVGIWRGYDPSSKSVVYMETREDGTGFFGTRVEGVGNQAHAARPVVGSGGKNTSISYDGAAWQMRGYLIADEDEATLNSVGLYEIRMIEAEDGTVQHRYVEIDDPYNGRAEFSTTMYDPWVRIDLQPGEEILSDPARLVGIWRGYHPSQRVLVYVEYRSDGTAIIGYQVEGEGDQAHVVQEPLERCVECSMLFDGSLWRMSGYALQDRRHPQHSTIGRYEVRLLTGADGSVQRRYIPLDDPYEGRAEFHAAYGPWVLVDLRPGERIASDLSDLAGIWTLDHPEGTLYMQVRESGLVIGGTLEGGQVIPTESVAGFADPQFYATSDLWLVDGVLRIRDTGGLWYEVDSAGYANRDVMGRYLVYVLMRGGQPVELRFSEVDDTHEGRLILDGYGPWTRVEP